MAIDTDNPYAALEDLGEDPKRREIVVRLIRKWETRNSRRGSQLLTLDLLLLDEKENLIKASINNRLIQYYKNMLKEGAIYRISYFDVVLSSSRYKLTDHKYVIQFTHRTIPSEVLVSPPSIAKTKFRIFSYDSLLNMANTNKCLPDVVGRLTYVWGSNLRCMGSSNKIMARIVLTNGTEVRVSIWSHIASDFRKFLSASKRKKISVIITAVNTKIFDGDLYLNTSPATKFFAYSDLKEYVPVCYQIEEYETSPLAELELDNQGSSVKTISHLLSFLDVEEPQEREFSCSAKIVRINTHRGWFHISCSRCCNQITQVKDKLMCSTCQDPNFVPVVRFRLEVILDDETDKGRFIIHDKEARKLTRTNAEDVVTLAGAERLTPYQNRKLPPCLEELMGRTYSFHIRVTKYDFTPANKTFSVVGIDVDGEPENSPSTTRYTKPIKRSVLPPIKIRRREHMSGFENVEPREGRKKRNKHG